MYILPIIFGAILVLFGGNPLRDLQDMGLFMFGLGILPIVAEYFMLRAGLRIDRVRRKANQTDVKEQA